MAPTEYKSLDITEKEYLEKMFDVEEETVEDLEKKYGKQAKISLFRRRKEQFHKQTRL